MKTTKSKTTAKTKQPEWIKFNIGLRPEQAAEVKRVAESEFRSVSAMIAALVDMALRSRKQS